MANRTAYLLAVIILPSVIVSPALAQRSTGAILGLVTDPSGGLIPGVTVTVSNVETGLVRTAQTNEEGLYTVTLLPVGRYAIRASKSGFQEAEVKDVVLHVDENLRVNIPLQVGAVTERITIEASA